MSIKGVVSEKTAKTRSKVNMVDGGILLSDQS